MIKNRCCHEHFSLLVSLLLIFTQLSEWHLPDYFPVPNDWKTFLRQGNKVPDRGDMATIPRHSWYRIDFDALQWEQGTQKLVPGQAEVIAQQYTFYLDQVIEADLQPQRVILQSLLRELKEVCQALAAQPIEVGSGLTRPRKRKQINILTHPRETLTHPRKVIMHPQRTYQDVRNDIANQLSGLPNFTARVKTSEN